MFVWRLTRKAHADDPLSGEGSRRYGGRWNHAGTSVVYTSQSLSLAVLEYLVNLPLDDLPDDLASIKFQLPDNLPRTEITSKELPVGWRLFPADEELKEIGTNWAQEKKSVVLVVPSAVVPIELNYVINPAHPRAKAIKVVEVEPFSLDSRLHSARKTGVKN
jgi:RES domain-containing protein